MHIAYCCVPKCRSWAKRNPELHFHRFPAAGKHKVYVETKLGNKELVDRRKVWITNLRIGKPVSKYMKVCSRHFKTEDYFNKGTNILKQNAVPTLNLPLHIEENAIPGPSTRSQRINKRNEIKQNHAFVCIKEDEIIENHTFVCMKEVEKELRECTSRSLSEMKAAEGLLELLVAQPNYVGLKTFKDFQVQVNTPEVITLCNIITTDQALNSFTGLKSFQLLEMLVKAIQNKFKDKRTHRLPVKDRIVLVLCKLKTNLMYATLSVLFGISAELCKKYILEMVPMLYEVLYSAIPFPEAEEIQNNIPICFRDFHNVRVILDCTEIFVQNPKCVCCRVRFYSHYKSNLTIKFMTGVSPGGTITFISHAFGGRASDKAIFENSGIITKLNQDDLIMVDKGFLIDDICERFKIGLVRPPLLKRKKQLSAEDAILNSKIAAARVHIERTNQRIKIFKILSDKLQWSLVPLIKEIMVIICGIANLSNPILADFRFLFTENN